MKVFVLIITVFLSLKGASAQDTTGLKHLVGRFKVPRAETNVEIGTGFIIARQVDTLYLVTAGHVLKDYAPGATIAVTLGDAVDTLYATIRLLRHPQKGDKEDLAICSVLSKGYQYPVVLPLDTLRPHTPVFYYHNQHLDPEFDNNEQTLITWSDTAHTYNVYMPHVAGGDSGGPVFTCGTRRLVGIILNGDASCEVLRMSYIRQIIKKELPSLTL